jgi:hypothetical protein
MKKLVTVTVLSGAAALLFAGMLTFAPEKAQASAAFAQQTGKACNFCHTAPPALNDQGKKFKANGNKL